MTDGPPRRIAFLGFGLIAGSIARRLAGGRAAAGGGTDGPELIAWSPSNRGPGGAAREGVIDRVAADAGAAILGADLVVLGAPPLETIELLEALGGRLRAALAPDAVVTDVASAKAAIVVAADAAALRFVGGHPMAGRELAGYGAASADLFVDRPWVIVPGAAADEAAVERVAWLAAACGAHSIRMGAGEHDATVAAISHLPLVTSAALVEAVAGGAAERPDWPIAASLAASGWRDMTRLARGDATMGAGIAATNAPAIAARLRDLRAALDAWIQDLEREGGPDPARLESRLRAVRDRLDRPPGSGA
ncbi:MAG TPA: prephenate dehydrogenase/arogenate dehydrogenase family protein [Candidatus Sulfomarinibacteraceae bacterium]|nr:prephenate dehydrogenase/arogenate dehydrogenase family protein [Candidatus Sulfomarinibacteraceae bacterium]